MPGTPRNAGTMPLLLLFAVGLGLTAVLRVWFSRYGVSVGLWGVEVCSGGCHGVRWDNVPGTDFDIIVAGYTATVSGLLAAVLGGATVIGGGAAALRWARLASGIALAAIGWFVLRFLIDGKLGLDWGVVVGTVSAVGLYVLLRRKT